MPRIDPHQLLQCLNVLLTPSGGIKSEREVARLSSLMEKFSKKLVSKCVYLLILRSSDPHLLCKFMGLGGWNLIYSWLVHAIEAKNYPFLTELLEVILICPVDIERLKSNPMPKQIKALSRDNTIDSRVKDVASDIVKYWLNIVKGTPTTPIEPTIVNQDLVSTSRLEKLSKSSLNSQSEDVVVDKFEDVDYVASTCSSSSSNDGTDGNDVFISDDKLMSQTKKTLTNKLAAKKDRQGGKPILKSKLITSSNSKESKSGPIRLKIEKRIEHSPDHVLKKEDKLLEDKLKENRKTKDEKEKGKFTKLKSERDKKDRSKDKKEVSTKMKETSAAFDEKLKNDLTKFISKPLEKLGRIPKISKDKDKDSAALVERDKDEKKSSKKDDRSSKDGEKDIKKDTKKIVPVPPPKKPVSMSVEKRFSPGEAKPKTVKAYNSKFRLTGLEQEAPKPTVKKANSSGSQSSSSAISSDKSAVKRSPVRDVEEPSEKRARSPDNSFSEDKSPISSRSKKSFLQESDSFMNAMNFAITEQRELRTKKKKPSQKQDGDSKTEDSPARKVADVTSPVAKPEKDTKPVLRFYKDTLECASNDESMDTSTSENRIEKSAEICENKISSNDPTKPRSAEGLKSALSIFKTRSHPKKSVKWKSDEELEAVQYFEVDATERTNVVRTFWDLQMSERNKERESLQMVRKTSGNDKMVVQTMWKSLVPIDLPTPATARGFNSQEKAIQYARERSIPPTLYYNKNQIPDTPTEPDPENHAVSVPPTIPLDDISGSQDSVNDFSALKWPEPKQFPLDNIDPNAIRGFVPGGNAPMFPPFPDGTFPPPFGQPFFAGGPMPPIPVAPQGNWNTGDNDATTQQPSIPWAPPNVVPPPGMMGPPPFGLMNPFPAMPGGFPAPNMFPPPILNPSMNNNINNNSNPISGGSNNSGGSNGNNNSNNSNVNINNSSTSDRPSQYSKNYSSSSGNSDGSKRWNSDDRYHSKKDSWKHGHDRGSRDRRGGWRGGSSGGPSTKMCRYFKNKGYCSDSNCRFYHPESWER